MSLSFLLLDVGQARRRNRNRIFPSMIFGMATLGCVIIPLGFHMLALLGGKAFFISKMALLVATITSMKKVCSISFNEKQSFMRRNNLVVICS